MLKFLPTIALALTLVSCAAPPSPLNTPSGRPEIMIPNVTKKQVADAIVASALRKGSQIRNVSDYGVTLAKRAEGNVGMAILYGSRYDSVPEGRIHLNMVDVPGGVLIYGRAEIVTNPGSGFERVNDVTATAGQQIQNSLQDIGSQFPGSIGN